MLYENFIELYSRGLPIKEIEKQLQITHTKYVVLFTKAKKENRIKLRGKGRRPKFMNYNWEEI